MSFNPKPRRVWTGMTVPGKKMIRLLNVSEGRLDRGKDLLSMYENPGEALLLTAAAIEMIRSPRGLELGAAARDLSSALEPEAWYGAILTDIRDFLKLRFRVDGASTVPGDEPSPESAVRYSIFVLHEQARRSDFIDWGAIGRVRDTLLAAGQELASPDELEGYAPVLELLRERRGHPPKWRDDATNESS